MMMLASSNSASSICALALALAVVILASPVAVHGSSLTTNGAQDLDELMINFSAPQLQVLHNLADLLVRASELSPGRQQEILLSGSSDAGADRMNGGFRRFGIKKRNSELLNSLLGLPKNILKSGKK